MTVLWPLVQARLVELLPTLDGWADVPVYDGAPDSAEQTDAYCAVGYVEDEAGAGSFTQTPSGDGWFDDESGEVRCELFTGNGDGDVAAARTAGFDLISALQVSLAADRRLGVLPGTGSSSLGAEVVTGKQAGAGQFLILTVSYTTS